MNANPEAAAHEEAFVHAFIQKDFRHRMLFELGMRRGHFMGRFSHGALVYLEPRWVTEIKPPNSDRAETLRLLRSKGAPEMCYALSMSDDIDGRVLPLSEALAVAVGYGSPTILSCRPGELAYLETEQVQGPPDRYLLSCPPVLHR